MSSESSTPSRYTSLNELPPVICRIGRTVTPGACIGTRKTVSPACLAADESVRRDRDAEVSHRRPRGPDLVPVEHPVAVTLDRAGAHGCEVGAGLGLGEELAGDQVGAQHRAHVALALLGGPPLGDRRRHELLGHREHLGTPGHVECLFLLPERQRVGHRQSSPAVLLGPGQRTPAGVELGLFVGADPVRLGPLLLGCPVLEDGDRVRADAPLGGPARLRDRGEPSPGGASELVEGGGSVGRHRRPLRQRAPCRH